MGKRKFHPDINTFYEAEAEILSARVKGVRAAVDHAGEKGRSNEISVSGLLRQYLPAEYGLSTGFVAYHDLNCVRSGQYDASKDKIHLSGQVDIIIYDALRSCPLVRLDGCDVFPIEAVYGYVEVKTSISSASDIRRLLAQSADLRRPKLRIYYGTSPGNPTGVDIHPLPNYISVRSFIFAFDGSKIGSEDVIAKSIWTRAKRFKGTDAFISGMYVNDCGFFALHPVNTATDPRNGMVIMDSKSPLMTFKNRMILDLSRFPRVPPGWAPAIDLYHRNEDDSIRLGPVIDIAAST